VPELRLGVAEVLCLRPEKRHASSAQDARPGTVPLQRGDRTVPLTRTEYALLETLIRRAGRIVPRHVPVEADRGGGAEVSDGTLISLSGACVPKSRLQANASWCIPRGVGYGLRAEAT